MPIKLKLSNYKPNEGCYPEKYTAKWLYKTVLVDHTTYWIRHQPLQYSPVMYHNTPWCRNICKVDICQSENGSSTISFFSKLHEICRE